MANTALKSLLAAAAGATALGLAAIAPAKAATLTYDFTVSLYGEPSVSNPSTSPITYKGLFSFDASQPLVNCSSPEEIFFCALSGQHNLSVEFGYAGKTYTQQDDRDYGSLYPAAYFNQTGTLVGLSFIVDPSTANTSFAILGREFYQGFSNQEYPQPSKDSTKKAKYKAGEVSYALRVPDPVPGDPSPCQLDPDSCPTTGVPEPSEIAGSAIAIGLLGMIWRLRRRRVTLKP